MLSLKSQEKLANLLSTISEGEYKVISLPNQIKIFFNKKLENLKSQLLKFSTFEPETAFTRLDRQQNGYLTIDDFNNFFLTHQTKQNNTELTLLFAKFRPALPQQIFPEEFAQTILPSSQQLQSNLLGVQQRKKRIVQSNQFLELKLEQTLLTVFQQLIRNARSYELYRDTLLSAFDFSQVGCYCSLTDDPYIVKQNLASFLKKHFRFQTAEELDALTNYLDYDCDGQISFNDFVNSVVKSGLQMSNIGECQYVRQEEIDGFSPSRVLASMSPTRQSMASPIRKQQQQQQQTFTNVSGKQLLLLKNVENAKLISKDNLKYSNYIQSVKGQSGIQNWEQIEVRSPGQIKHQPNKIVELLNKMINMDRELTQLRIKLSERNDFNLLDAFSLFDPLKKQKISQKDCIEGLEKIGIQPSQEQIFLLYLFYDQNNDGFLQFGDFCKIFYTKNQQQIDLLKSRPANYIETTNPTELFSQPTLLLFTNLFHSIFQCELSLDELRLELQLHPQFNLSHAFSSLDQDKDGRISYEELKLLLSNYGIETNEGEMQGLFERFDKDRDGEIKFMEFMKEMEPKSPVKRRRR